MTKKIKFNWKVPASWVLAVCVSLVFVRVTVMSLGAKLNMDLLPYLIIPIAIVAVPFYVIIKKNILR